MLTSQELESKLRAKLPAAEIRCQDLTGGGDHWRVSICAEEFRGLSLIEQHQLIYQTLGSWMHREIHALSLDTSAP